MINYAEINNALQTIIKLTKHVPLSDLLNESRTGRIPPDIVDYLFDTRTTNARDITYAFNSDATRAYYISEHNILQPYVLTHWPAAIYPYQLTIPATHN